MKYYLGGYYLISLCPYPLLDNQLIYTCSSCINDNLLLYPLCSDYQDKEKYINEIELKYKLNKNDMSSLSNWINNNLDKIRWPDAFSEIKFVYEYKNKYFKHINPLYLFAIYFDENETNRLLDLFKTENDNEWCIGIYRLLKDKIIENDKEKLLGYDLIGLESVGDFHTFHCNDLAKDICNKFGLILNKYGLFDEYSNWDSVSNYINSEEIACEPVPWFVTKVKMVYKFE